MALNDEQALLIENSIRQNNHVLAENRLLREELERSNRANQDLLRAMNEKIANLIQLAVVGNVTRRQRENRAPTLKVPKLCSVSIIAEQLTILV